MISSRSNFVLACAVIAAVFVAGVLGALRWQEARIGQALAGQRLQDAAAVQALVEQQRGADLRTRGELIAGNQAFASYVAQALGGALPGFEVDTTSITDLLEERRGQLGLGMAAVLDAQGRVIAAAGTFDGSGSWLTEPLFVQARDSVAASSGLWVDGERLLHVAVLPLAAVGTSDGYLVVGLPLDLPIAQAIADASGTDVALLRTSAGGLAVHASTLDDATRRELAEQATALAAGGTPKGSALAGRYHAVGTRPLLGSQAAQVMVLLPAAPVQALAGAAALPWLLGSLAVALALLTFAPWLWRRVLAPVEAVVQLLDRASGGDPHLQLPPDQAGAMTRLAAAFNGLMQGLRRVP